MATEEWDGGGYRNGTWKGIIMIMMIIMIVISRV